MSKIKSPTTIQYGLKDFMSKDLKTHQQEFNEHFMYGSCHIWNALIDVEYWNCCQTFDVYLLFAIWKGQIQWKLIYIFVSYGLATL